MTYNNKGYALAAKALAGTTAITIADYSSNNFASQNIIRYYRPGQYAYTVARITGSGCGMISIGTYPEVLSNVDINLSRPFGYSQGSGSNTQYLTGTQLYGSMSYINIFPSVPTIKFATYITVANGDRMLEFTNSTGLYYSDAIIMGTNLTCMAPTQLEIFVR